MGKATSGSDAERCCLIRPTQLITRSGRSEFRSGISLSSSSTSTLVNKNEASFAEKNRRMDGFRTVPTTSKLPDERNERKTVAPSIPLAPKIKTFIFLMTFLFSAAARQLPEVILSDILAHREI